jgi:hypothetical protein
MERQPMECYMGDSRNHFALVDSGYTLAGVAPVARLLL